MPHEPDAVREAADIPSVAEAMAYADGYAAALADCERADVAGLIIKLDAEKVRHSLTKALIHVAARKLESAAMQFRLYERNHRAKIRHHKSDEFYENARHANNAAALAKAETNREMAEMCEAAIRSLIGDKQ
jgi:hypothetical protein